MTRDRARKKAIRSRMAESGEPYSVAARRLGDRGPGEDPTAVAEVVAKATSTLVATGAWIEVRRDWDRFQIPEPEEQPHPTVARLARFAAREVWRRITRGMDPKDARERFMHHVGEGFVEPIAGRYQIEFGGAFAVMYIDGQHYAGPPGRRLQANNRDFRRVERWNDPLRLLRNLGDVVDARYIGDEAVCGTPCRSVAVSTGSGEFTVWIDDEHIRRIQQVDEHIPREGGANISGRRTLELWDFGADVSSVDWTRLPSFRTAEHRSESDAPPDGVRDPI